MAVVLSTHELHPRAAYMLQAAATLKIAPSLDPAVLTELCREADIIIVRAHLPEELIERAFQLRAAIRHGTGVDMIPLDAATRAGVLVSNVPGANARSVAEFALSSVLMLARRRQVIDRDFRVHGWVQAREHATSTEEIGGKTIGLIGLGHVGQAVARLALGFGMAVVAYKPSCSTTLPGIGLKPLETVIAEADALVLCCPVNDSTRGLINGSRLRLMKRSAFLINVARGPVVAEADLIAALDAGAIAGAALDVFDEQPLPTRHPLMGRDNVLLTPHLAGITGESMERMGIGAAQEALRVLEGRLPLNLVNPEAVSIYRARFGDWRTDGD